MEQTPVNPPRLVDAQNRELVNSWECVVRKLRKLCKQAVSNIEQMKAEANKTEGSALSDIERVRIIRDEKIWEGQRNAYSDILKTTGILMREYDLK